jgi:hypothetical protein
MPLTAVLVRERGFMVGAHQHVDDRQHIVSQFLVHRTIALQAVDEHVTCIGPKSRGLQLHSLLLAWM